MDLHLVVASAVVRKHPLFKSNYEVEFLFLLRGKTRRLGFRMLSDGSSHLECKIALGSNTLSEKLNTGKDSLEENHFSLEQGSWPITRILLPRGTEMEQNEPVWLFPSRSITKVIWGAAEWMQEWEGQGGCPNPPCLERMCWPILDMWT